MDSRIREALEIADKFCNQHTADECPDTVAIPIKEALSLLTAEPEPCEDALEVAGKVQGCNHDSAECVMMPFDDAVALIDAYASRRIQEAREDERLEGATIVDEFLKLNYPEQRMRFGITLCAAILQGTEPLRPNDLLVEAHALLSIIPECRDSEWENDRIALARRIEAEGLQGTEPAKVLITDELLWQEIYSLREKLKIAVAAIKSDNPSFDERAFTHRLNSVDYDQLMEELSETEPAKVSEDVERDIETVRHAITHVKAIAPGNDSVFEDGIEAFDRLVSRIKEGQIA